MKFVQVVFLAMWFQFTMSAVHETKESYRWYSYPALVCLVVAVSKWE